MATFGVNAGALEKFNKGWENIIKVKEYKIKPVKVGLILQQNYSLKTCRAGVPTLIGLHNFLPSESIHSTRISSNIISLPL
jgi:hypothetical protein